MSSPTSTLIQQSDNIQQLALQSPLDKAVYRLLKDIQKTIGQRHKKTQVYNWTVEALQRQCRRSICEDRLLAEKHESRSTQLAHQRHKLEQDITQLTHELQSHDIQLQSARSYAHQRHTKYLLRQRQFHRYAKIPMVGRTYKQKYLRAQNKNQLAESDVAAQRHGMDHIKDQRMMLSRQLQQQQQEEAQCAQVIGDIRARIGSNETLDRHWQSGHVYWTNHAATLCLTMDQKVVALQHLLRQQQQDDNSGRQELVAVLQTFRQTCVDFHKAETYGDQEYSLNKVDFICAKCMTSYQQDTPRPDKNHTTELLCPTCYQAAHTSMVIKKKLGFLHTPSSSSTSTSSSSLLTPSSSRQSSFVMDPSIIPTPPPKDHSPKHLVY